MHTYQLLTYLSFPKSFTPLSKKKKKKASKQKSQQITGREAAATLAAAGSNEDLEFTIKRLKHWGGNKWKPMGFKTTQ